VNSTDDASADRPARRPGPTTLRRARLAEVIASDLRRQILSGDLVDGDRLPPVEGLMQHYEVSAPSVREALRVLETEGLVTMRLGKLGGATIRRPRPERAAYMLGLVLEAERARADDVSYALLEVILACARTCADRADRATTIVPTLSSAVDLAAEDVLRNFDKGLGRFHRALTLECGNQTLALLSGALSALWGGQELEWPYAPADGLDRNQREVIVEAHRQVLDAIRDGDAPAASSRLHEVLTHPSGRPPRAQRQNPVVKAEHISRRISLPPYASEEPPAATPRRGARTDTDTATDPG
jgi:GntR family transcriptional repressor for pyruvate dehydrogenase complex